MNLKTKETIVDIRLLFILSIYLKIEAIFGQRNPFELGHLHLLKRGNNLLFIVYLISFDTHFCRFDPDVIIHFPLKLIYSFTFPFKPSRQSKPAVETFSLQPFAAFTYNQCANLIWNLLAECETRLGRF